ncbi:MAG TPA: MFS transporter, partial [Terriglobales bacterium]|nr:MFS transporter [Terriglobales bacterium]
MTRTERTYYLVQALYHCSWSFTAPIYSLFLLSRGLDLLQINLVFATYLLAAFLFEVPTGAIADRFGRKLSFLLSCVVRASAFFYYYFADSFGEFLVAEFIDAIGTTLATGALDAWAVDGIRGEGDHRPKDRMFARAHMIARMPMMLSGLVAGYIAEGGLEIPFLAGTTFFLITALAGWTLMQDDRAAVAAERARSDRARGGVLPVMRAGWQDLRADATLRLLWWLTFVISFAALPTWHYWPPRMEELSGGSVWLMGWVFAGLNLSAIIGTILSSRLQTWRREWLLAMATLARAA